MTVEVLIGKILEKSKAENVDLLIAAAMVREDVRVAEELTPEVDVNLDKASDFFRAMQSSPKTSARFAEEGFEKASYDEWLIEAKKELHGTTDGE